MASSQVACVNLFLPLLENTDKAAKVLSKVNTDLDEIAVDELCPSGKGM